MPGTCSLGSIPRPARRLQYRRDLACVSRLALSKGIRNATGEVLLVEEGTGKGHLSKAINEQIRHCIYVTLD